MVALPEGRPLVLAHRGAGRFAPHNSLEAIAWASSKGVDGIEVDVRATATGDLVLAHDDELAGGFISKMALEQVTEAGVPSLGQVLDTAGSMIVNLELKGPVIDVPGFAKKLVAAMEGRDGVIVSSFWLDLVKATKDAGAHCEIGVLTAASYDPTGEHAAAAASDMGAQWAIPEALDLDASEAKNLVDLGASSGVSLMGWTVNDPAQVALLYEAGFKAVITDEPLVLRTD